MNILGNAFNIRQGGQAMTEMLVASAFVVVPLFLIIPTVGKYIDMKHAAVNSARYTAWERTVFFNDATLANQPSNFRGFQSSTGAKFPIKSDMQIATEAQFRIFAEADAPIQVGATANREFWTYHDGSPMYTPNDDERPTIISNQGTPDITPLQIASETIDAVGTAVGAVTGVLCDILEAIKPCDNPSKFDAINMKGFTTSVVEMSVVTSPNYGTTIGDSSRVATPLITTGSDLMMRAKAGVLSQTWSAGGGAHLKSQAQALAPTKLVGDLFDVIDIPLVGSGQDAIALLLLAPEFGTPEGLTKGSLVFGQMDIDALPRDKFAEGTFPDGYESNNPVCNNKGYCRE